MVKVATSLDAPIKILWPKSTSFSTTRGFTMLGLGDIVIPGLFISLALRYDLSRSNHKQPTQTFAKPYFTASLIAYVIGLVTTMTVMHVFGAAQPALLYLRWENENLSFSKKFYLSVRRRRFNGIELYSPACILSFILTGLVTGNIQNAWSWKDEVEEDKLDGDIKEASADIQTPQISLSNSTQEKVASGVDTDGDAHEGSDKPDDGESSGKKKRTKRKKAWCWFHLEWLYTLRRGPVRWLCCNRFTMCVELITYCRLPVFIRLQ